VRARQAQDTFNAVEKAVLIEDTVINGHVEQPVVFAVEEAAHAHRVRHPCPSLSSLRLSLVLSGLQFVRVS
jgi:hypothetical protein